jgi:hypothetical protein
MAARSAAKFGAIACPAIGLTVVSFGTSAANKIGLLLSQRPSSAEAKMIDSFVFIELRPRVVVAEPGGVTGVLVPDDDSIHLLIKFATKSLTEVSVFERLPFCVIRHGLLRRPPVAATARPIREPKMPAPGRSANDFKT